MVAAAPNWRSHRALCDAPAGEGTAEADFGATPRGVGGLPGQLQHGCPCGAYRQGVARSSGDLSDVASDELTVSMSDMDSVPLKLTSYR